MRCRGTPGALLDRYDAYEIQQLLETSFRAIPIGDFSQKRAYLIHQLLGGRIPLLLDAPCNWSEPVLEFDRRASP